MLRMSTPEQPKEPAFIKIVSEASKPSNQELLEATKTKVKAWTKKWTIRVGGAAAVVAAFLLGRAVESGKDLTDLRDLAVFGGVVTAMFLLLNKVK